MRFAVWTYAAAVALASLAVVVLVKISHPLLHGWLNGKPLPNVTTFLIEFSPWALVIPLPWLCAAIWLSRRNAATADRVFAYAGISTLAIVFMLTFTLLALVLPFVVDIGPLSN